MVIAVVLLLVIAFNLPFAKIQSTERGVVYRWGAVQGKVLGEGLHMLTPVADVVKTVKITPIPVQINIPVNSQGAITKDNQTVGADVTLYFRYKESELVNAAKNY